MTLVAVASVMCLEKATESLGLVLSLKNDIQSVS